MKKMFLGRISAILLAVTLVFGIFVSPAAADSTSRPESDTDFAAWYTALSGIFSDDNFAAYVANAFTKDEGFALTDYPISDYPTVDDVLAAYTGNVDASFTGVSHAQTQNKLNAAFEPDITLNKIAAVNDVALLPKATTIDLTGNLIYDLSPLSNDDPIVGGEDYNYFGHVVDATTYIDTTINLNGNPLTIWPADFCGHIQLVTNNRSYPLATVHFLNDGTEHSIKVPIAVTASQADGVYIYQAVDPNSTPTGATWTKAEGDVGASIDDSTSNLLTNITITGISMPGSFSYGFTTSFSSRFYFNKYNSLGGTTHDQLTYSLDYPFNVELYNEYGVNISFMPNVQLTKTDADTDELLGNVEYELYSGTPDGEHTLLGTYTTGATEDDLGLITVSNLENGDYYFLEKTAVSNEYKLNKTPLTFTINSEEFGDGNTEISSENSTATLNITKEATEGDSVYYTRDSSATTGYAPDVQSNPVTSVNGVFVPSDEIPVLSTDFTDDEIYEIEISRGVGDDAVSHKYTTLAQANAALAAIANGTSEDFPESLSGKVNITISYITALSQTNEKYETVDVDIEAGMKTLIGGALSDSDYEFTITGINDATEGYTETVTNDTDGYFDFTDISISAPGIYIYKINEEEGDDDYISYDTAEYYLYVYAREDEETGELETFTYLLNENDNALISEEEPETAEQYFLILSDTVDSEMTFVNTKSQSLNISAEKTLIGKGLKANAFSFTLTELDAEYSETVHNDKNGHVVFSEITVSESGIYIYSIQEKEGIDLNIIYDSTIYYLVANVTIEDGVGTVETVYLTDEDYDTFLAANNGGITSENFELLAEFDKGTISFTNTSLSPKTGEHDNLMYAMFALLICAVLEIVLVKKYEKITK